jgi:hypothetical protein
MTNNMLVKLRVYPLNPALHTRPSKDTTYSSLTNTP